MPTLPALMPLTEADYEAIADAVMETNRGRWFLAEYAKRNRHADTTMLLAAIERIEATVRGERADETVDRIRFDLLDMARAIARTKAEIAAIKPDAEHHGKFGEATEELDSIVSATEAATSDILAAAERIQEIAWTLREQGLESEVCDLVDAKATEIYTACSFQDLTGQRSRKVIQVLRYLEGRINAMIDIWGLDRAMAAEAAETANARGGEAALLNGPARPGHGLDQADIDVVMGPATVNAADDTHDAPVAHGPVMDAEPEPVRLALPTSADPPSAPAAVRPLAEYRPPLEEAPSPALAPAEPPVPAPEDSIAHRRAPFMHGSPPARRESAPQPDTPSPHPVNDPLAPIMALSADEKIALFS
jgi:chemotaxis protein CheZ